MSHECPTCGDGFDTQKGMKIHHSRSHGEPLTESTECEQCGDEFTISDPTKPNRFCSVECNNKSKRDRITLTCDHCNDDFEVERSASYRQFCSRECQLDSRRETYRSECEMCGQIFRHPDNDSQRFCCQECYLEWRTDRPRPEDIESLLWLLYVYEGYDIRTTYRRQRAIHGASDCLTTDDVREKLDEMGVKRGYNKSRWTLQKMNPEDVGESKPAGDESYKQYYSSA